MVSQTEFTLRPRTRGFHLITDEVVRNLPPLPQIGSVSYTHLTLPTIA